MDLAARLEPQAAKWVNGRSFLCASITHYLGILQQISFLPFVIKFEVIQGKLIKLFSKFSFPGIGIPEPYPGKGDNILGGKIIPGNSVPVSPGTKR